MMTHFIAFIRIFCVWFGQIIFLSVMFTMFVSNKGLKVISE